MKGYVIESGVGNARAMREALNMIPKELQPSIRRGLRLAAAPILADARQRSSWSTRIPRSISANVRFSGKKAGIRIRVAAARAPHARPYEGLLSRARDSRRGTFRHPVFGRERFRQQWTWTPQAFRPFLAPAVEAGTPAVEKSLLSAVDDVLRRNGF